MNKITVRTELDKETVDALADYANEMKKQTGNHKIGASTVASRIVTLVIKKDERALREMLCLEESPG